MDSNPFAYGSFYKYEPKQIRSTGHGFPDTTHDTTYPIPDNTLAQTSHGASYKSLRQREIAPRQRAPHLQPYSGPGYVVADRGSPCSVRTRQRHQHRHGVWPELRFQNCPWVLQERPERQSSRVDVNAVADTLQAKNNGTRWFRTELAATTRIEVLRWIDLIDHKTTSRYGYSWYR